MSVMTYDTDFYLWTQQQTDLLRQGAVSAIDVEHLIEQIESMGASDRGSLGSFLELVMMHLLKWRYQPERRGSSWRNSIRKGHNAIERAIEYSPSLNRHLPDMVVAEYRRARKSAADETDLPLTAFPEQCPFTVEQITGDWWPESFDCPILERQLDNPLEVALVASYQNRAMTQGDSRDFQILRTNGKSPGNQFCILPFGFTVKRQNLKSLKKHQSFLQPSIGVDTIIALAGAADLR